MRRILAATIVCAFALVTIVSADEAQKRALAEELLDVMDMQKNLQKSTEMIKQMLPAQLKQMLPAQPKQMGVSENASWDKAIESTLKTLDLIMKERSWEKIKDDYIAIYSETFTEEQLSGLLTFYKSPIGRKFIEKQPELTKRFMQISQKWAIELMPKLKKLTQEMLEQETAQPDGAANGSQPSRAD